MDICVVNKDAFYVCGCFVETTLAQNEKDVTGLYHDFFGSGKEEEIIALKGARKGYFGLSWYTQGHERYCYLLGLEVGHGNAFPAGTIIKKVPNASYAKASFPQGTDIINAWNEFFYSEIPRAGLRVNEKLNIYFEYYPGSVSADYELWIPVVRANV